MSFLLIPFPDLGNGFLLSAMFYKKKIMVPGYQVLGYLK